MRVTPPSLEPGSTGYQTCTLNAMPKSQARWYGSQSTYSCVVTVLRHTALPSGQRTLAFHAHRHSLRIHQPYFSHPKGAPHTSASPIYGVPTWGSLIGFYRHASDDLTEKKKKSQ